MSVACATDQTSSSNAVWASGLPGGGIKPRDHEEHAISERSAISTIKDAASSITTVLGRSVNVHALGGADDVQMSSARAGVPGVSRPAWSEVQVLSWYDGCAVHALGCPGITLF